MSPRAWAERVQDILGAITEIQVFTQGMTFDKFQGDAKTIKAVQLDSLLVQPRATGAPCPGASSPGSRTEGLPIPTRI
ncbi:MAG: hypothetical protein V3R80_09715, partial [Candidatus Tectomicrobia bacterium]